MTIVSDEPTATEYTARAPHIVETMFDEQTYDDPFDGLGEPVLKRHFEETCTRCYLIKRKTVFTDGVCWDCL